jgi:dihydroorotase (multifunctional complex type)
VQTNDYDLVVKNGRVFTNGRLTECDVAIRDGRIEGLLARNATVTAKKEINAHGLLVLPGIIDTHAHFREPGFTHKEDIESGTRAAAVGGVTMAVDMPNVRPTTNSPERFETHRKLAEQKAIVDFNHWAGPPQDLEQIKDLMDMGAMGIKVFMWKDTQRDYPHMPELGITDLGYLYDVFFACEKYGAICGVHPHTQDFMQHIEKKYFWDKGLTDPKSYAQALRFGDSVNFDIAISTLILLARSTGVRLHVLHTNTDLALKMIEWAHSEKLNVTSEMNPMHVYLKWEDVEKIGPYSLGSWTPPKHAEAIRNAWREAPFTIVLGTDHSPHTREEKEVGWENMWKAHGGAPCIEHYVPLLLGDVNAGLLPLERVVELCSEAPAKLFGFYPRKGAIQVGSDADLTIVDMNKKKIVVGTEIQSKCKWSPFDGWELHGIPVYTVVRGTIVMKDGEILVSPGFGQFVNPARR